MLEVSGISVAYGKHVAVDRIALTVKPGEVVLILGANGSGKTSLLKAIAGITQVGEVRLVPSSLSTMIAQLRHCAAPQPNLVPVMPSISRRKSFIERSSRTSIGPCFWPLMVRLRVVTRALPSIGLR